MFKCEFTGKLVREGVSPVTAVVEKRQVEYNNVVNKKIKITYGWEIVKEIKVSPDEVVNCLKHFGIGESNE